MFLQLTQLVSAQFKEFIRNPGIIFWALLFPILMAWGLGIAFTQKGELTRTVAVYSPQKTQHEKFRAFLQKGATDGEDPAGFSVTLADEKLGDTHYKFLYVDWPAAELMIKRGKATVVISELADTLQYHFDPLNPEAQLTYLQLSAAINNTSSGGRSGVIMPLTETGTRYIDFLIPGLMGMGIMMSCMWGISYNLIDKRSKKLLRRMVVTPMKKNIFLLSHFVSRVIMTGVESALLFFFAWWYFDIEMQGSLLALCLIFFAGVMAFTGIAIFMSSRTDNSQIGNGLINLVVMPMMVMSGIFFSYHNFPEAIIPIIQFFPLTILADGVRSIFIEGAGLAEVSRPIIVLALTGVVFFSVGLRIYKWY